MKHGLIKTAALITALFLAYTVLPISFISSEAAATADRTVPAGYNEHDYDKCVTFLEQTDPSGEKNGEKLSSDYDPDDPETWGTLGGF